ncbi:uvrD-like Helicase, ATP-binding domain, P-loop containing nucleoside triphosphate hydrolase [Artemisia annua]|uniref:UvrD-like Helicase, ATP-binding domain, P-loop containing nucleoside triphosphate hydrolase n=1 Tax=Artemisia annua TaxID=35608 RepID=A0A2U1NFW3_ARTAN|nr:uvrD-like Helicase, ATP-binding domain, P-loop containing nucleoside triphosphate hydrolase [Artemisia annua]
MEQGCLLGAAEHHEDEFTKLILSWSLDDICNQDLYKTKVDKIPLTFESEEHYFGSFVYPLLEETHFELASSMEIMYRAPFADILSVKKSKSGENMLYSVTVGRWRNQYSERGKDDYYTLPGDLLLLVDGKPESVSDMKREGRTWKLSLVKSNDDDGASLEFKIKASQPIEFQDGLYAVFVMNITTQKRIWNSLHMHRNLNIVKEVLYSDSKVKEKCGICSFGYDSTVSQKLDPQFLLNLNESQRAALMSALCKMQCCHISFVEQIWGPPGTGKTMTVSVLLLILLQMRQRNLACAPTNVAIVQLASRVQSLVRESFKTTTASGNYFCSLGDLLLFGSKEILKVSSHSEEIYLEHRVKKLAECLGPVTGWKLCIRSMIDLLENCVCDYYKFLENEFLKEKQLRHENEGKSAMLEIKSFNEYVQERFNSSAPPLRRCIVTFCTHISRSFMGEYNFQNMISLFDNISSLESLLFRKNMVSEELEDLFNSKPLQDDIIKSCLSSLRTLQVSLEGLTLPCFSNKYAIKQFCFESASIIFCTTSSSYKLHAVNMEPLNIVVIDEAAQLKEAESTIPLQLPGVKHAILIGDECQLPALVNSNVCIASGFARSLFDRLSSLGHSKHLLNVQYRMHPSISFFPNWKFYHNQILDAQNVLSKSYEKRYLSGPMFGSYSFINVVGGREEKDDDGRSLRNMVEVAVVNKLVKNLYKACQDSKKKLTIGVISPYAAQVFSIQEKLAHKYEKLDGFSVTVKSIDGFQGGEEDIIILSTVRSNSRGCIGFVSCPQRANVALTRARHCLWILGNERTLTTSESIWKDVVCDARNRHCLFDADADECLKMIVIAAMKELEQLDDLVNGNSVLFKHAKWKVLISDEFRRSFGKLTGSRLKKQVLNLLLKLSSGWRPKNRSVDMCCENSSQILKQFKVEGIYAICGIDIIKEVNYTQVLKVWDILALEDIPELTKRLENIYSAYTDDYISRCTEKCLVGNLDAPRTWPGSQEIIRFRYLKDDEVESEASVNSGDAITYVENSKVSESLLLMKFYSFSHGVVSHLLSGKEVDLPMQVTDEQMDIILSRKSSFIIGRSGTGKTTILTMKLFQHEHNFQIASDGIFEAEISRFRDAEVVDDPGNSKPSVLHQLFVTVSPRLCYAVKQHVSHLTSSSAVVSLDDTDVITSEFDDIADTFINIQVKNYPLVITFQKFLMMLDGTLESSFFERFRKAKEDSHGTYISSRSVAMQTFIRSREVTFDKFCSLYWPHFNTNLTKKLDSSRVFTEIISHIKGGLLAGECSDGKVSYEGYCLLAKSRSSTLTREKREIVYNLFQAYEKMKSERGEFDLGDFVNDIHRRLKNGNYKGDQMDFVYIDEVQDLSMRQLSLFRYICQNVDEGFMFAGDTAQTIAKGIDFRFQDIRSLFYKEFLSTRTSELHEKGLVSEIKQLKQNFRTHAGVLDLAQSVIDIMYHYYIQSIDKLEPEISLLSGEPPVLLESGKDENAIVTIFGGSGSGEDIVGFGAEQAILDVLLYNFFGTSPLKEQWRVIYGYMKQYDWLKDKLPQSIPAFNEARHSVLCSELKQLYVAITRTRQRLWICENNQKLSKPMFDYWKKRGLVQVKKLDDSVAQAMRVASSPQEWRERGKKFFYGNNFVMASMCFERAGDTMWEKLAKASGLRASAYQMRGTNHEAFQGYVREAAGIFESIGKLELAASCYCDLEEYERAGKIYVSTPGKIDAAAECFILAGCYSEAVEAYAKDDKISNCLSVCKEGKLFEKGLQYINYWKEHSSFQSKEIQQIQQEFLESCALDYHEHKDPKSMMKFVRAFYSMESKRVFLRSLGCLDDLLLLEEESGHFFEAAELAKSWGDLLKEANLLEKVECFKEAAILLLWYVCFRASWGNGNRGWPLKQFDQKEAICNKVKSLAKMDSVIFYDFVCSELKVISDQHSSLPELKKDLHTSRKNGSFRGEILSIRKILDIHFHLQFTKYEWEDELPIDINEHCDKIFENQVSVRTLVFYWNLWKENVVDILESLGSFHNEEPNKHHRHLGFSLNHFGARECSVNGNIVYLLVDKDAEWRRTFGQKGLHKDGKRVTIDARELVFAIRSYWQSELLSVGIKVLETLEGLHKSKSNGGLLFGLTGSQSYFHQSTSLLHIYEVSKFLLDCQYLNVTNPNMRKLKRFLEISLTYFDLVFPLDWRNVVSQNLVSLRETDLSVSLLEEIILQLGDINLLAVGRMIMICLGSRVSVALYEHLIKKVKMNPKWKSFVEKFRDGGFKDVYVAPALQNALEGNFRSTAQYYVSIERCLCSISPHSFVYLLDRLLLMHSFSSGYSYTTRSSLVESFTHIHSDSTLSIGPSSLNPSFLVLLISDILHTIETTIAWIQKSNIDGFYYPLFVLKLVMILSLICLKVPDHSPVLLEHLSDYNNITDFLPKKFVCDLLRKRKNEKLNLDPEVVAEAFISIDDPLLILSSEHVSPEIDAPCAIFVDLRKSKEEIESVLFPRINILNVHTSSNKAGTIPEVSSSNTLPDTYMNMNTVKMQMNWKVLDEISNAINGKKGLVPNKYLPIATMIKAELDMNRVVLITAFAAQKFCSPNGATIVTIAIESLKVLSFAFDPSREEVKYPLTFKILEIAVSRLQSYKRKIDKFLNRSVTSQVSKVEQTCDSVVIENQSDYDNTRDGTNQKGKGNKGQRSKKSKEKFMNFVSMISCFLTG